MASFLQIMIVVHILIFRVRIGRCSGQIHAIFYINKGKYLANSVIRTEKTDSEFDCSSLCSREDSCMSVNYKISGENQGTCELNNKSLEDSEENGREMDDFVNLGIVKKIELGHIKKPPVAFGSCPDISKVDQSKMNQVNLAYRMPTIQSSTLGAYVSSRATDGSKNTDVISGASCTNTNNDYAPWWRVDLENEYLIYKFNVTNRGETLAVSLRLSNFEIRIGSSLDDNGNINPACGEQYSLGMGETRAIICDPPLVGKYVNIVIPGRVEVLTLCEVEVFGYNC